MKRRYILVYWFFLLVIDIDFLFTNADVLSYFTKLIHHRSFTNSPAGKEPACNAGDPGLIPGSERSIAEGIDYPLQYSWASLVAHLAKNLPAMWVTWVWSLGWEDPLEKGKDYPLQYSGLENSMDCIVHGVSKNRTRLSNGHFHFHFHVSHTYRNLCCLLHEIHCLLILNKALWSTPLVLPLPFFSHPTHAKVWYKAPNMAPSLLKNTCD